MGIIIKIIVYGNMLRVIHKYTCMFLLYVFFKKNGTINNCNYENNR